MSKPSNNKELINEALQRGVQVIYPSKDFLEKTLQGGKKLKIYLGVDPTGPHLHLGHATNLLVLKRFQELGHKIIFLIGDFTARIGDPTDKLAARQPLTEREIKDNFKTFKSQAEKIISFKGKNAAVVDFNSRWHKKMSFEDVIKLASNFTVQQMIERDMFQERLKSGKPISVHEFLYPLMQGYDSVAMDVDMEIGGTDQTFNMLAGRTLMKIYKQKEKFVLSTKLLENPKTGKKLMNKSEGGLINLDDKPNDMFGKVMALDDSGIIPIAELCTEMSEEKIKRLDNSVKSGGNPRDAKLEVALEVVGLYHSEKEAEKAKENFINTFSKKDFSGKMEEITATGNDTALQIVRKSGIPSNSEARRLIEQGAVEIDGKVIKDPNQKLNLKGGETIKIGKKKFFRVS
jgi:tyrosyl-tRNA synthetase